MSDINLPGISSENLDVKAIIEKLVKVEAKKIDRLQSAMEVLNKEKSAWSALGTKIDELKNAAQMLYGFRSPFDEKIAISSDEALLSATATRIASPSRSTIRIEQIATSERILSDPIDLKRILEPVSIKMRVGSDDVEVYFNGGRVEELADAINKQAGDYLSARVTRDTPDTGVVILEVKKPGQKNRIFVEDPGSIQFLGEIGLFKERVFRRIDTRFIPERISPHLPSSKYSLEKDTLILEPENGISLKLETPVKATPDMVLKVQVRAVEIPPEKEKPPISWPQLRGIGSVTVRDVEVVGGGPVSGVEVEEKVVEKKPEVRDDAIFGVKSDMGQVNLVKIEPLGDEFREYTFKLTDIVKEGEVVSDILFVNKNTSRKVEYKNLSLIDESAREGALPRHLSQEARNAIISVDGIRVERDTNQIDDAIKGVTLNIKRASEQEIQLKVDHDFEKITGAVIDLVSKYNELLKFINEQTRVISTGNLKEENQVGVLAGDITVMGLKSKLQTIMMNPYPTERGRELSLLAQIGISMGRGGSVWNDIKGGYLQIDEDKFIETFQKDPSSIKQLFGSDMNNDMIIDNGIAFVLDNTLKGYTEPRNGIVAYHLRTTDIKIKDQEKSIENWNQHLEEYRKKLEKDFTLMQQALNELEQNQKRLENISNQFKNK